MEVDGNNLIAYQISGNANGDAWSDIIVVFNGNNEAREVRIPEGDYKIIIKDGRIDEAGMGNQVGGEVLVEGRSALVLVK